MHIDFISDAYTTDGLKLPMVHFESEEKDICVLCIHGMCGTIIDNYFATVWGKLLAEKNIGFIYEHNRGHSIENDIVMKDAPIILLGHSYGCNKVIYYYYKKHPTILGIILASAPDMVGIHKKEQNDYKKILKEAKRNIENGEPRKLLSTMIEDYMYMSSQTYYNWYHENSNLDNLPVLSNFKSWDQFSVIDVPILTFSGSKEKDEYLHLDLLKEKAISCKNFTYKVIENTGHTYWNKEVEIGNLLYNWVVKNFK